MRKSLILALVIVTFFSNLILVNSQSNSTPIELKKDEYNVAFIASQWEFTAFDLNRLNQTNLSDYATNPSIFDNAAYKNSMGPFIQGKTINFIVYSKDVQHGFAFNYNNSDNQEVTVALATIRPTGNQTIGEPVSQSVVLPTNTNKILIYCHIFCGLGHPNMKFELTLVSDKNLSLDAALPVAVSVAVISLLGVSMYHVKSKSAIDILKLSKQQKSIISDIFQNRTSAYFYILNQSSKEIDENTIQPEAQDIFKYKFLLHPVRLSIMKLLYENIQMTSLEIKEKLGISWNDVGNHITALKEKGYISTDHQFQEGSRKQVVSIEPFGTQEFKVLTELLHLFLDSFADVEFE